MLRPTFDGATKRITLAAGTTNLDLIALHSWWKLWVLAGNAASLIAFNTVGGDIPAIPLYLFLRSSVGWKIVPQSADHTLTVTNGILETDDGSDPFVDPSGAYKIRINRESPGIAIGYSTSGVPAPTAEEVAAATGSRLVDGTYTADQIMRVVAAILAGKVSGAGTGVESFRDLADTKNRVVVTVDNIGNRSGVVIDAI